MVEVARASLGEESRRPDWGRQQDRADCMGGPPFAFTVLIHGDANGAERLSSEWAVVRGISVEAHPADWKKHGRAGGPIRNQKMLEEKPELVVAIPGGRGTADRVRKAKATGLDVIEVEARHS